MADSKTSTGSVALLVVVVVIAAIAYFANEAHRAHQDRNSINDAIADGLREEVKAAIAKQRSSPKPIPGRKEQFESRSVAKAIRIDYDTSSVFIPLDKRFIRNSDVLPDAWISFTAVVQNDAITGWKCDKHGVPVKLLPAECK